MRKIIIKIKSEWRRLSLAILCIFAIVSISYVLSIKFSNSDDTVSVVSDNFRIVRVACVNFRTVWGDKEANLEKIKGYIIESAKRGADIIVFPELALTGYEIEEEAKMHKINAETIPDPSTKKIAVLTGRYGVYVVFGMPERDKNDSTKFYNSAAIIGPEGVIGSYAKLMPYKIELKWCKKGKQPVCFDTPWGLVGVGICYETYMFPELPRYYAAIGARLYLNITSLSAIKGWKEYYLNQLRSRAIENMMFVASSNLVGKELKDNFVGTSLILGPAENSHLIDYYAGPASTEKEEIIGTIDLMKAEKMRNRYPLFASNTKLFRPEWRLKLYKDMLEIIDEKTELGKYDHIVNGGSKNQQSWEIVK